jgi:xylulokinase
MPHDFVVAKLCGETVTDHTMAAGTMMYDINKQDWNKEIIDTFGIDADKLPGLSYSAKSVGTVLNSVAAELGLPSGVKVCVGGQDQKCASFGAGISEGIATISLGTATAIGKRWTKPHKDDQMRIPSFSFLFEKTWFTEGVLSTAAACMRWLKETFFEDYTYEQMSAMVDEAVDYKTELSFYPHFVGNGTPNLGYDSTGMYTGIHLNTTRQDFVRALFEGIAMQIEENLEVMEGTTELRVFGGGAMSSAWCEIIADVTNSRVKTLRSHEVACSGAAMLAGLGSGVYKDEEEASSKVSIARIYEPNTQRRSYYKDKYEQYKTFEKHAFGKDC